MELNTPTGQMIDIIKIQQPQLPYKQVVGVCKFYENK
jgi:hypothetical protein